MIASKVSIIISNFNKAKYVSETIQSVINQTYINWELLIIDDGSFDNSINIIESFSIKDNRIKLFALSANHGANYCRNYGLSKAQGMYVIFLDSDDILIESCLQNRLKVIQKERLDFCVFTMGTFEKTIGDSCSVWIPRSSNPLKDFLSHKLPWSILQPIWQRSFLLSLGGFDEQFLRLQDVELHSRALTENCVKYKLINSLPDCYYRIDTERRNYNTYDFLERWMISAVKYCNKMEHIVPESSKRYLFGTIIKSYQQIVLHLKQDKITSDEFNRLEKILFDVNILINVSFYRKTILRLYCIYNIGQLRIPGINRGLELLIII